MRSMIPFLLAPLLSSATSPPTASPQKGALANAPSTPKHPVTDRYHGVEVKDDYRWLEDEADSTVQSWVAAQNERTRSYLSSVPTRAAIEDRVRALLGVQSPRYFDLQERGSRLFALKMQPPKQQPMLVTFNSPDDLASERVIVDPNSLDPKGTTAIDFYVPNQSGNWVAVSLSEGGTESGTVHVYEAATGKERTLDVVPRVQGGTAGGSVAWKGDDSGFFHTLYPAKGRRPPEDLLFYQQIFFHKLGTPADEDIYALGKDASRIAEFTLRTSPDGRYTLAAMQNGDSGEFSFYLLAPSSGKGKGRGQAWKQLSRAEDAIVTARFGRDNALYLLSHKNAPRRKILRLPLNTPSLSRAKVIVPEGDGVIEGFVPARQQLYVSELVGGPSRIRIFTLDGKPTGSIPLPSISSVSEMLPWEDDLLFANVTYTTPATWYRFSSKSGTVLKTAIAEQYPFDFGEIEVTRELVTSKDGTKVPLNIVKARAVKRDGAAPALLTGYGGFNLPVKPGFLRSSLAWLEQGGVLAIANLRGGGEFGEEWHDAGRRTHKQNVFDDFYACAQYLVNEKYTNPERLAIRGGSNGGLLMGAALTQHPEMYRAVVSYVGIYDMLRVETSPNGTFNIPEYGTVRDPDQFKALYAYSPYHHVADGTRYAAVLLSTGANDPRVDPMQSFKMTAWLQAATTSGLPILLRYSTTTGHGIDTGLSERIAQLTDEMVFLADQLKIDYRPVSGTKAGDRM